ncbi:MAG TPA: PIG-L deacetylase family protein [Candidatus Dormibacteraeota bacterium]|nr:PIG-L deacetylase family protein [Candidatus Dormibacteraeota bacterium]
MERESRQYRGPDDQRIRRVLCITAHPDDAEFFCGGTLLLLTRAGAKVDLVVVTSGDKGAREPDLDGPTLAMRREHEQLAAGRILGLSRVEFLRHPDAGLIESLELRGELVREIRRSRPDLLITFDPTPQYRQHPDHRVVGRMALDAAWPCARDRLTHPDAGPPHETPEAWLFGAPADRIDLTVDVSGVLEEKIRARLEHRSQTRDADQMRQRWQEVAGMERFVRVDLRT